MFNLNMAGRYRAVETHLEQSVLLEEWQLMPGGPLTQLRQNEQAYWLSCPEIGAVYFRLSISGITAYPVQGLDPKLFEGVLVHEWLPLIYQAWGCQVLHASAVVQLSSGRVVAFAGETGMGKSTLGYGMGQQYGWAQLADDSLAFRNWAGGVHLLPIANAVRLRPDSAGYFNQPAYSHEGLRWPDMEMSLDQLYLIEAQPEAEGRGATAVECEPLNGAQAYPQLLQQAYALTTKLPEHNRRLLLDYLELARQVQAHRLVFCKTFRMLEEVFELVERQVCQVNSDKA